MTKTSTEKQSTILFLITGNHQNMAKVKKITRFVSKMDGRDALFNTAINVTGSKNPTLKE